MGIFDFFNKKEKSVINQESSIQLAMPMFENNDRYELKAIIDNLQQFWKLEVINIDGNNDSAILTIEGKKIAIAFMPFPIPFDIIEEVANLSYNWITILEDIKNLNGHSIVSILPNKAPTLENFILLSKVLYSILVTSKSIGVFKGSQSLIIPTKQFIKSAENLKNDNLPIDLWIYIGIRVSTEGNSIYTYGLNEFGKNEIEIINSKLGIEELYNFISNICSYVIGRDVILKDGETLGITAEQKIKITLSSGIFIEGKSLKLNM